MSKTVESDNVAMEEGAPLLGPDELQKIRYEDLKTGHTSILGKVLFVESNMTEQLVAIGFNYGWMRIIRFRVKDEDKKKWKPFSQLLCCEKMISAVWSESTGEQKLITMSDRGTLVVFARQKDERWKMVKEIFWRVTTISPSLSDNRIAILDDDNCLMFGEPLGDFLGKIPSGDGAEITCFDWGHRGELIYGHENGLVKVAYTEASADEPVSCPRVLSNFIPNKVVCIQCWKPVGAENGKSRPRLAIAYKNGIIQIRKDIKRKPIHENRYRFEPKFMRWSPDASSLAIVALEKKIKAPGNMSIWFLSPRGESLARFRFCKIHIIRGISWCPSGNMLHVAGDRYVKLLLVEPSFEGEISPEESPSSSASNLTVVERVGNMFTRLFNV